MCNGVSVVQFVEFRLVHWHNRYCDHPALAATLDTSGAGGWTPAEIDRDVQSGLAAEFDSLRGAFGTSSPGELIARLALGIQDRYDCIPDLWGTVSAPAEREEIFFAARDHVLAPVTLRIATSFVRALVSMRPEGTPWVASAIGQLHERLQAVVLDQSSRAMMAKMIERGIPVQRAHEGQRDLLCGIGSKQKRSLETLTSAISSLGVRFAHHKFSTLQILSAIALPVGRFAIASNPEQAVLAAQSVGYPLVLKPNQGAQGKGVAVRLNSPEEVRAHGARINGPILIQTYFPGDDHRLLVVKNRLVAAARRLPACVTGNGIHSVAKLVEEVNRDPDRGLGFEKIKVRIALDAEADRVLSQQGFSRDDVPPIGKTIHLRATANISTGGTAMDVTTTIHPDNAKLAVRAAAALGLDVAGIDFLTTDITRSWRDVGGGICEVNAAVGLRPHWIANPDQDVVGPIVETLYSEGENGRIPTVMVTGTNGKTTTCNMLDVILREAGHVVGKSTTVGVEVDGERLLSSDAGGAMGAGLVLSDPLITAAVLETARGGLLKWGTVLEWCDVAALLNVDSEHVGLGGIDTIDDMAALKRKVVDCARKAVVLNADCPYASSFMKEYPADRVIAFSLHADSTEVQAHIDRGGRAIVLRESPRGGTILFIGPTGTQEFCEVSDLPSTLDGLARHNIANAMAACGLALGLAVPVEIIRSGLQNFETSVELSPGRQNFEKGYPFDILFDWTTNPHAFAQLIPMVRGLPCAGRKLCAFGATGNRPDSDYVRIAKLVAGNFDHYFPYDREAYRRGREEGEVPNILSDGLIAENVDPKSVRIATDVREAMQFMAEYAKPNDLLVILGSDIDESRPLLREIFGPPGKTQVSQSRSPPPHSLSPQAQPPAAEP